ncbi:MAG: hypothetical protein ACK559_22550 [bacterium]
MRGSLIVVAAPRDGHAIDREIDLRVRALNTIPPRCGLCDCVLPSSTLNPVVKPPLWQHAPHTVAPGVNRLEVLQV